MTVTYDFVNITSTPVRLDIARVDQTKIVPIGDSVQAQKNGNTVTVSDFVVTGSDALNVAKIQQRMETRRPSDQYSAGFDRGAVVSFSLRLTAPMTRTDSVSGETVAEDASVTLAVNLPFATSDLDGLMDFIASGFGLVADSIDGTSHEPLTANLLKLAIGAKVW